MWPRAALAALPALSLLLLPCDALLISPERQENGGASPFAKILKQQAAAAKQLVRGHRPPHMGATLVIRNNTVETVLRGTGWVHPERLHGWTKLFNDTLARYTLPDAVVNINFEDKPKKGYFNFCRRSGQAAEFLLPNFRFAAPPVDLLALPGNLQNYDDVVRWLEEHDRPLEEKDARIFTASTPHEAKMDYFEFALHHSDICAGWAFCGPPHGHMKMKKALYSTLKRKGLAGDDRMPFLNYTHYKYLLYEDGNTLSDRMSLIMPLNAVVIRKSSAYEEIYTYLLKEDEHYVSLEEVSELPGKLKEFVNLERSAMELERTYGHLATLHQELESPIKTLKVKTIVKQAHKFVHEVLKYDNILGYVAELMHALF